MADDPKKSGSDLFIVDNSDHDWKVRDYLHGWCQLSESIDVATGFFEIGSLLALDGDWQKVDRFRILMGDEISQRTVKAFNEGLERVRGRLDASLEAEKEKNAFLKGVAAIVEAIATGKIQCRVYRKEKFHAKAYITHARQAVIGSFALVGSSNFTFPGLTDNVELNVQIAGSQVTPLQEWYDRHWDAAKDITPDILRVIERHTQEYEPFDVYAKALHEFFRGHEMIAKDWEQHESKIYPILAPYQREGYDDLLRKAAKHNGAFLCDGVGLGKTFIGLMLIERLIMKDRLNIALFVPRSAREPVWEASLKKYLPKVRGKYSNLAVFNHTDLMRGGDWQDDLETVLQRAHVVIIDEAHHFRNTGTKGGDDPTERKSRYWRLFDIIGHKMVFMLTATPVNNGLLDLQHMIELFSRHEPDYFKNAPLGIHSLPGHFRKMEKELEHALHGRSNDGEVLQTNFLEAGQVLDNDALFKALVVQRSRAYVKKSLEQGGAGTALFPEPRVPRVAEYSVKQTYGKLLALIDKAFHKKEPLFSLPIYSPAEYYRADAPLDPLFLGRQTQVVALIRIGFLKRFESSAEAFTMSCWTLLKKLLAWVQAHAETKHEKQQLDIWRRRHDDLLNYIAGHQLELFDERGEEEPEEDIITPEMLDAVTHLGRVEYDVEAIISATIQDLDQIAEFLKELSDFKPSQDKKLSELLKLLTKDPVLSKHKVLIFTEFKDTARYLRQQLVKAGVNGVAEVDSSTKDSRGEIIRRFAPYYNGSSSPQLAAERLDEIRVLISTDVLSEGLNLQDCTRLINYDLHWNPVRLMQRIGRIDRRLNPEIEAQIIADHPQVKKLRGTVEYYNFLPPEDLERLLGLYARVAHKTLRISKTFGIEGRKLLRPDDEFDDLRDFMEAYNGAVSPLEQMRLDLSKLFQDDPGLEARLKSFPGQLFSGKEHPTAGARGVFFCYRLPAHAPVTPAALAIEADRHPSAPDAASLSGELTGAVPASSGQLSMFHASSFVPQPSASSSAGAINTNEWTSDAGESQWYYYDLASEKIVEEPTEINEVIRCAPETPRRCAIEQPTLVEIRQKLEKHIKNTYLKKVQAPVGVRPVLTCWMELN